MAEERKPDAGFLLWFAQSLAEPCVALTRFSRTYMPLQVAKAGQLWPKPDLACQACAAADGLDSTNASRGTTRGPNYELGSQNRTEHLMMGGKDIAEL